MDFRKIISIGLLILIIIINLGFSMVFTPVSREGLYMVQNPYEYDLKQMTDILNDSTKDNFTKIKNIYDIVKKYAIMMSIYNNMGKKCLDSIIEYIKNAPIKDRNGANIDENVISKKRIENINNILASKMEYPEKVFAIRQYICDESNKCDNKLSSIYTIYEELWIDSLKQYIAQLNSNSGIQNKDAAIKFGYIDPNPRRKL